MIPNLENIQWVAHCYRPQKTSPDRGVYISFCKSGKDSKGKQIYSNNLTLSSDAMKKAALMIGDRILVGKLDHQGKTYVAVTKDKNGYKLSKASESGSGSIKFGKVNQPGSLPFVKPFEVKTDNVDVFGGVLLFQEAV